MNASSTNLDKSVPLSAFSTSTRFEVDPRGIHVSKNRLYPGCIGVTLPKFDHKTECTRPGGSGLVFAGEIPIIGMGHFGVLNQLALLFGFDEVFKVNCFYYHVVVLQPLGVGLGVDWELYQQYAGCIHGEDRPCEECARRAQEHLTEMRLGIAALTGPLDRPVAETGPYYLHEETDSTPNVKVKQPLSALTVCEARLIARERISELRALGWECGQEASQHGVIDNPQETDATIAWLCLRGEEVLRVSVQAGVPELMA